MGEALTDQPGGRGGGPPVPSASPGNILRSGGLGHPGRAQRGPGPVIPRTNEDREGPGLTLLLGTQSRP